MNKRHDERVGPTLNPPHLGELIRESMEDENLARFIDADR